MNMIGIPGIEDNGNMLIYRPTGADRQRIKQIKEEMEQAVALSGVWTGVLASERSADGILEAIRAGQTYASEVPQIKPISNLES